ncbi:malic enzyme, putative, partial [Entamoeba invadens IP1]
TEFYKTLVEKAHKFYRRKIQIMPKCTLCGFNWFNAYYTPGVSRISTNIRDDNDSSLLCTMRGNFVGVVSDSIRVLGDGDVTPAGIAICIDSKVAGKADAGAMIEFVQRIQHTFGAINLEDISQPNCYRVLDVFEF